MLRTKILKMGQYLIDRGAWYFAPISWVYQGIIFCRNKLYDYKFLPVTCVKGTVVSVGNVLAGGTGKTPFVQLLAEQFPHRKVGILCRGYGEMPDEALLLAKRLPHVKVYVGKDRVALAKAANVDLLILDDGFQHRRLHRDFDLVLHRRGKHHYLPWGFLRDSLKRLSKADELFYEDELQLRVKRILDLKGKEIPSISGWRVGIFCGIARPENFKKTIQSLGAEIIAEKIFADHEQADLRKLPKVNALICTEKDAVKLTSTDLPIYYLEMEMKIRFGKERWEKLVEKIDQKIDNKSTYE